MKAFSYNIDSDLFKSWSKGVSGGHNRETYLHVFIFKKSFSPESVGQFQSNLVKIMIRKRKFKIVQIKGQVFFKGEIITKLSIKNAVISKSFSRTAEPEELIFTSKCSDMILDSSLFKSSSWGSKGARIGKTISA
jgi:hypothetical protein